MTTSEIRDFKMCIKKCELQDIVATGGLYTWNNRQGKDSRVYTKFERCLINIEWSTTVDATATFLPEVIFDHTLIMISFQKFQTQSTFKFCEMWTSRPSFINIVEEAMKMKIQGCHMY